jgi:hypothetical protein
MLNCFPLWIENPLLERDMNFGFHRSPPYQDAEKTRQRRSRIVQILNVPQRVRLRSSLAAALLDSLFEHPAIILTSVAMEDSIDDLCIE